jgi:membrane associated rhomboid family serine protease
MNTAGYISIILIIANFIVSYKGFTNPSFFEKYAFDVDRILIYKDYKRLLTSGFLHVSWLHLLFNLFSLYLFSGSLEVYLGGFDYLIIYMASLVGGNLFSLFIHRHQGNYSSVGASGAVCGIIFATIALFPGMGIGFFLLPFSIPGWLYGLAFVLYSIYGIKSKRDNTGHEAHLGGALVGLVVAILMRPSALVDNFLPVILIAAPALLFIYFIIRRPETLLIDNSFSNRRKDYYSVDHKYNAEKSKKQKQVNAVLDKIHRRGIDSLTKKEKQILDDFSQSK